MTRHFLSSDPEIYLDIERMSQELSKQFGELLSEAILLDAYRRDLITLLTFLMRRYK